MVYRCYRILNTKHTDGIESELPRQTSDYLTTDDMDGIEVRLKDN